MATTKGRKKRCSITAHMRDVISEGAINGQSPSEILKTLKGDKRYINLPDLRTIQRYVKQEDKSGIWKVADNNGEDARLVLDVLASALSSDPLMQLRSKCRFTKSEAQWIIRLRKVAPDAPAQIIILLSQLYMRRDMRRKAKGIIDTADLDGYLAFTPWRDKDCYRLYKRAVFKGWIPKAPLWTSLVDNIIPPGPYDPRFTEDEDDIRKFTREIYKQSKGGSSPENIAVVYEMHPEDVKDIIKEIEAVDEVNHNR